MKDDTATFHDQEIYQTSMFTSNVHEVICMICYVLGYDSDEIVDNDILGFLRAIFPSTEVVVEFYVAELISKFIDE